MPSTCTRSVAGGREVRCRVRASQRDHGGHEVAARRHRRRAEFEPWVCRFTAILARTNELRAQWRARGVVGDEVISSQLDGAAHEAHPTHHWQSGHGAQGVHEPKPPWGILPTTATGLTALVTGTGRHEREATAAAARQPHVLLRPAATNALLVLPALGRPLQPVWKSTSVSSRVDGVQVDATIQHERAVKF